MDVLLERWASSRRTYIWTETIWIEVCLAWFETFSEHQSSNIITYAKSLLGLNSLCVFDQVSWPLFVQLRYVLFLLDLLRVCPQFTRCSIHFWFVYLLQSKNVDWFKFFSHEESSFCLVCCALRRLMGRRAWQYNTTMTFEWVDCRLISLLRPKTV